MPRVSILMPAYDAAAHIEAALASACAQSEPNLEILVIDDCSTDDTAARVLNVAESDPRVRLLRTPRNGGPSAARNVGLEAAKGDWVALLDADDTMAVQRIAVLTAIGEAHGAQMVSDNILLVDEAGVSPPTPMIPAELLGQEQTLSLAEFIARNVGDPRHPRVSYGFMKPIIRREFLNTHQIRYDEQVRFAEDFALYVRCLSAGAIWRVTPQPMYHYLVRTHSLTEVQTSGDLDRLRSRQRALLQEPAVQEDPVLCAAIRRHLDVIDRDYFYRAFTDALKARRIAQASALLLQSPRSLRMITAESLRQTPIIASKALRGGYGQRRTPPRP